MKRLGGKYAKIAEMISQSDQDHPENAEANYTFEVIKLPKKYLRSENYQEQLEYLNKRIENIHKDIKVIIFDFQNIDFIDSSGLKLLINCYINFHPHDNKARFILCGLISSVRVVFDLTQLDKVFPIYPNVVQAKYVLSSKHISQETKIEGKKATEQFLNEILNKIVNHQIKGI